MAHTASFLKSYLKEVVQDVRNSWRAAFASIWFQPSELANCQFLRYVHYREIQNWVTQRRSNGWNIEKGIEFGGTNGLIRGLFADIDYEAASNWPQTDIQNLVSYDNNSYDVVVIDNVLEHVPSPEMAIQELWRILRPRGACICTTPFLIKIHADPGDYWRFTEQGLRVLFRRFQEVHISGWGNRYTLKTISKYGWLSARNTKRLWKVALWNEGEWPISYLTVAIK